MENLAKAFVYLVALLWAGTEILILASNGTSWPLGLGFLFFATGFVVVGCAPLKDSTVNAAGRLFFSICVIVCLAFAIFGFTLSALGLAKLAVGAVLCVVAFRPDSRTDHHSAPTSH